MAYQYYDFMEESLWLRMLRDHNDSSHIYDEPHVKQLARSVINEYMPEVEELLGT